MEVQEKQLHLYGADSFVTQEKMDAYRVASGSVFVYIVPWKNGKAGRRLPLCQVRQGGVIPAFVYTDQDYEQWRFSIAAGDDAVLDCMAGSVTSVLKRNFSKRAGLEAFEREGFEKSLVDYYRREALKDDVYLKRGEKNEPSVNIASYGVIRGVFKTNEAAIGGDDPTYKAVAYACRASSIPIIDTERLAACCGRDLTVPNIAMASRFICREVVLEPDWYCSDCGALVGDIGGEPVACVPKGRGGYRIYRPLTGKTEKLDKKTAETVSPRAYSIGRALPDKKLSARDLFRFGKKSVGRWDVAAIALLGVVGALIGVLLPVLNQKIYDEYIPLGNYSQLVQLCCVIGAFMLGNLLFAMVKKLSEFRALSRVGCDMQNAVYYRVFHLPENFFRRFDSADLAQRLMSVSQLAGGFASTVLVTGLTALFSFIYLFRMFKYSPKLAWAALAMLAIYGAVLYLISSRSLRYEKQIAQCGGEASSKLFQYINGIEKIRMAGVEDRAAYEYLLPFAEGQSAGIRKNRLASFSGALSAVITTVFSMALYYILIKSKQSVSMGSFIAFETAFGAFSGAILQLLEGVLGLLQMKPSYDRVKPVLETAPEDDGRREMPGTLSGAVGLEHVTFSYGEGLPNVLTDLSLDIRPGEYLGIAGPSGCGKSTLLKLLLGFESPRSGKIYYDGKDLNSLDKRALRKNLGVVLQNGKLIAGSIFENITITAPHATMREVEAVIEAVGLKEDVEQMPMGLHTVLSESSGTISGGQQQRILIARAIISRPSMLIFDEATSALDNVTQAAVCDSLDRMNVTRIVVAHRLSTIKSCDRILVMDGGKIAEQGNYDALMEKKGLFYQLASRQIAEL